MTNRSKRFSLNTKITLMIVLMSAVLTIVSIFISYDNYKQTMNKYYIRDGQNLTKTAASQLDGDKFDYYIKHAAEEGVKDEAYNDMLNYLRDLYENNNVAYLYVVRPEPGGFTFIFDTEEGGGGYAAGGGCELGEYVEADENFAAHEGLLLAGQPIEPVITPDGSEYGWLLSVSEPIKDSNGKMVGYVMADISMDEMMKDRQDFMILSIVLMSLITVAITTVYVIILRKSVVNPINRLSVAARDFVNGESLLLSKGKHGVSAFDIKTNDEIEELSLSIKKMEEDITNYVANITKITAEKERISTELDVAASIQLSILPSITPDLPKSFAPVDIYAKMTTAKEVGGDFYDFFEIDATHICLVTADVSGKGVPAALFMVLTKTIIKNYALQMFEPSSVFEQANNRLIQINNMGMFVTAFIGVLNTETGEFKYANAGHNAPYFIDNSGNCTELPTEPGFVLAALSEIKFMQKSIQMKKGDRLFIYTDGVTEAENPKEVQFGEEKLIASLQKFRNVKLEALASGVQSDIDEFIGGASQADDITMLIFEYKTNK